MLLMLSEKNQLDPNVWLDLLNTVTLSPGKFSIDYQTRDERLASIAQHVTTEAEINLQESTTNPKIYA